MTPTHEVLMEGAREIQATFTEPDDDWLPVVSLTNSAGDVAVLDVVQFFANDETRELLAQRVLPKIVADMDIQELVLVTSCWILDVSEEEMQDGYVRPRDNPSRREVLQVAQVTPDGVESWHALITRDGVTPPTLGEFEKQGELRGMTDAVAAVMAKRHTRGANGDSMPGL